jgi:hypothetical protein
LNAVVEGAYREQLVSAETPAAADNPTPGEQPSFSARRADALARIAESFLAHGAHTLASGERHHLVVHVDAETLRDGGNGRCEHEDGPSLAVETARRLGCDASVVAVLEDENGEPLNVGRKSRTIPLPYVAPCIHVTSRAAASPAARTSTTSTVITSSTGRMAAKLACRTLSFYAATTIGRCTMVVSSSRCSTMERFGSL